MWCIVGGLLGSWLRILFFYCEYLGVLYCVDELVDVKNNDIYIRLYCCSRPSSWGIQQSANTLFSLSSIEWIRIFHMLTVSKVLVMSSALRIVLWGYFLLKPVVMVLLIWCKAVVVECAALKPC